MGNFFRRPQPQQAIPQDLRGMRGGMTSQAPDWLRQLGMIGTGRQATDLQRLPAGNYLQKFLGQNPEQQALEQSMPALLAMLSGTPGGDVLNPLRDIAGRNLEDSLAAMRAGVPNRMSSAALWQEGATRQRSAQDFNLLAQQTMEQGRARQIQAAQMLGMLSGQAGMGGYNRALGAGQLGLQQQGQQVQALMALLGPMLGAAYGGPMTQGTSGFENLLSLFQTGANVIGAVKGGNPGQPAIPKGSGTWDKSPINWSGQGAGAGGWYPYAGPPPMSPQSSGMNPDLLRLLMGLNLGSGG